LGGEGGSRTFIIDTGFNAETSKKRKRTFLRCPVDTLGALGIDANAVEDVILTHLHYDMWAISTASQPRDFIFRSANWLMPPGVTCGIRGWRIPSRSKISAGRVMFYHGDAELAPGLTIHAATGHSAGLQFVAPNKYFEGLSAWTSCSRAHWPTSSSCVSTWTPSAEGKVEYPVVRLIGNGVA
jgi:glyoxylase-like metal-dependent hydrolase (beta-lactamase superfamily II)